MEESRTNFFSRHFVPRRNYIVTPVLFQINFLLYLIVSVADRNFLFPSAETILQLGGDTPTETLNGESWRILAACFLHFGIIHFAANMLALLQLGKIIEEFIGSARFALVYLICGIAGGVASNWWYYQEWSTLSVGASGAIFGLLGFFLALVTTDRVRKEFRIPLLKSIGTSLLLNLAISAFANFNNAAHLGGLLTGVICGYLMWMIDRYLKNATKILYPFLLISFSLLLFFFILPQVSTKFAKVAASFERIDTDKKAILTALEKKLKQDSVRVSDTVFFNLKWEELLKKNDSLQFQLSSESLKENLRLNKTELDLRKKESLLLIRISAGDSTQVKALKKVQQQLSELNSTSQ